MPQIRMLRQPQVLLARPERDGLEPSICNHIFKIRIRDDLHPMPPRCERSPQPDHRMDVAIATQRGNQKLTHELFNSAKSEESGIEVLLPAGYPLGDSPLAASSSLVTIRAKTHNVSINGNVQLTRIPQYLLPMDDRERDKFYTSS